MTNTIRKNPHRSSPLLLKNGSRCGVYRPDRFSITNLAVLFVLGASLSQASVAVVQHKSNSGAASSNKQAASVTALHAGNLIVVGVCATGSATVSSITDNGSTKNTYQEVPGSKSANGTSSCDVWYAVNSHSGATSITATFNKTGTFEKNVEVWEVSGMSTDVSQVIDTASVVNNGPSTTSPLGAAVTTTTNSSFIAAMMFPHGNTTANPASGNPFTAGGDISSQSSVGQVSLISSVAGTYQPQWTTTNDTFNASTAAFKGAVTTPDTQAPTVPTNVTATAASSVAINVSWTASTDNIGVAGYRVFRNGTQITTTTATSFSDTGLSPATSYVYTVAAFDAAGNVSAQSSPASATTAAPDTTAPSVPTNLRATSVTSTAAIIAWDPSTDDTGVAGYRVSRNGVSIGTTSSTSFTDSGLLPATAYSYTVSAFDAAQNQSAQSAALPVTTQSGPAYPLKVHPTGRYLIDQAGKPFLLVGEAAWSLIVQPSSADVDLYLQDRAQKGFNTVLVNLIEHKYATNAPKNHNGDAPFTGTPFATPNEAYFQWADHVIQAAAQRGMNVLLVPLYLGFQCQDEGWCVEVQEASDADMIAWGQYVGNRYKNFDNITWVIGADVDPTLVLPKVQEFVNGILQFDTRHAFTAHNQPNSMAIDPWGGATWLNVNDIYNYSTALYDPALTAYAVSPTKPYFLIESTYENEHSSTPQQVRAETYFTLLSGGFGHVFGNCPIWNYDSPLATIFCTLTDWHTWLNSKGSMHMSHIASLFGPRNWFNLVPDQNHTTVTAGFGTFGQDQYVTASRSTDGTLMMAYLPASTTLTVDLSKLTGAVNASWFDPTNGTFTLIAGSPMPNTGPRQFTPPGANHDGDPDWVLVIETAGPDTQAPTVPANASATGISATQIQLSWNASTDDRAVAGYQVFRDGAQIATTTSTTYIDSGLQPQSTHSYTVAAFDAANNVSAQSTAAVATTSALDTTPPSVPANLSASNVTNSSATINWTASTDNVAVAGYQVFRNGTLAGTVSTNSYNDSSLSSSTTYSYTVAAFDASGNTSAQSQPLSITTPAGPSPIAAYSFSEGTGTTTADSSGNGITGTLVNSPVWSTGKNGSALTFNGSNTYVDLGVWASLNMTGSMTLSAWVFETANVADDAQIIAKSDGNSGWQLKSSPDTGLRTFAVEITTPSGQSVARYSNTVRSLNTWYYVAGVYNASTQTLDIYVNGVLDNGQLLGTVSSSQMNSSVNANIGRRTGGFNLNGIIDDLRIYNAALTQSQIQSDMNTPVH